MLQKYQKGALLEGCCKVPMGAAKCQKVAQDFFFGRVLQSANGCCKKRSLKISFLEGCCKVPMGAAKCQDTIAKPLLFFFDGCEAPSSADKCQNVAIHLSH